MKLTFFYSDLPIEDARPAYGCKATFEFPDEALNIADCRKHILKIATLVGEMTDAIMYITCKELDLQQHPIKLAKTSALIVTNTFRNCVLYFEHPKQRPSRYPQRRNLKILLPSKAPYQDTETPLPFQIAVSNEDQRRYLDRLHALVDTCLLLLNADAPHPKFKEWRYLGFRTQVHDNAAITQFNKAGDQRMREALKRDRAIAHAKARQADPNAPAPSTGAGRRPGAVPGIFKGVQFRSQLEIRFASELESRGIRWRYEVERLGEGNYLVDFYLPDLKVWVEVKGRFEPRDDYLLKEVAAYLKQKRGERLLVYTSGTCFAVHPTRFTEIKRQNFWERMYGGS
ncbi:MAG: hypothetical protein K8J31_07990 [Anaerolineae bacterium]|nr:hypothetical protein [Anaerolineae bacterium]